MTAPDLAALGADLVGSLDVLTRDALDWPPDDELPPAIAEAIDNAAAVVIAAVRAHRPPAPEPAPPKPRRRPAKAAQ